jgi:hypothetical protein
MATKPINTSAIGKGTGRSWEAWLAFLKSIDAETLSHKQIAERVAATGDATGWWSQSIAVAFEQSIGRRAPGQDNDGTFQLSASRTLPGTMDEALVAWTALVGERREFGGVAVTRGPETSRSEKFCYWRCALADGSRVSMSFYEKSAGRASIGLGHEKLVSASDVERWRAYWKALLKELRGSVTPPAA